MTAGKNPLRHAFHELVIPVIPTTMCGSVSQGHKPPIVWLRGLGTNMTMSTPTHFSRCQLWWIRPTPHSFRYSQHGRHIARNQNGRGTTCNQHAALVYSRSLRDVGRHFHGLCFRARIWPSSDPGYPHTRCWVISWIIQSLMLTDAQSWGSGSYPKHIDWL